MIPLKIQKYGSAKIDSFLILCSNMVRISQMGFGIEDLLVQEGHLVILSSSFAILKPILAYGM